MRSVVGLFVLAMTMLFMPETAQAAPVMVEVCDPAAATALGDPTTVTIPDDTVFKSGKSVAIQVSSGDVQDPTNPTAFGHVPVCAVFPDEQGNPLPHAEWIFCLEREKYACEDESGYTQVDGGSFTARDRARLAWIFANAEMSTKDVRAQAQTHVWCVTDKTPANTPNADAVSYYAARGITVNGICPDWLTIDPTLPLDPDLSFTAVTTTVPAGQLARVRLDTTATPITLTAKNASVSVCADSGNGTLEGDTLTLDPSKPVLLCLTSDQPGEAQIVAERHGVSSSDMEFWQYVADSSQCQALLRQETAPSSLHAQINVTFVRELPAAGIAFPWHVTIAGFVVLMLGTGLRLAARR